MNERRHHRMYTLAPLAAASLALLSGCGGANVALYRMPEAYADLRSDYSEPITPAGSKVAQDLAISLSSRPSLACSLAGAMGDGSGCIGLNAVDESAERDETRNDLMGGKPGYSWVLHDFGPTLASILKERLEQRFRTVTVTVDPTPRGGALEVKATVVRMIAPVQVTLDATSGGRKIHAMGESAHTWSRAHLAWAIPVGVMTFPLSMVWVPPIMRAVQEKHAKIAIADALDHAAASLATQLAERP